MKDLSSLLNNPQFSDVDVVVRVAAQPTEESDNDEASSSASSVTSPIASEDDIGDAEAPAPNDDGLIELARFPGHTVILCQSDYFHAQVHSAHNRCHLVASATWLKCTMVTRQGPTAISMCPHCGGAFLSHGHA